MNIEFHYYLTAMIAQRAGFSEADAAVIAYSSQYVDDNDKLVAVLDDNGHERMRSCVSQTLDIMTPPERWVRIWPVFHFPPGDPAAEAARRHDGTMHVMNTTPDSPMAGKLLAEALADASDSRLHRIGIATHTFVDSWAHQNFVGAAAEFNNIPGRALVNVGHADATTDPDIISKTWQDSRLASPEVINNQRFIEAAEALFRKYSDHLIASSGTWYSLAPRLESLMTEENADRRQAACVLEMPWLAEYDPRRWLQDALQDAGTPFAAIHGHYRCRPGVELEQMDWYRFQMAAKEHQDAAVQLLLELRERTGVGILDALGN